MVKSTAGLVALAALTAGFGGCGSGQQGPDASVEAAPLFSCETETRAVPYEPGLTRMSKAGVYTAVLVTADPGPPAKGPHNTWTVRILDGGGMPVDNLAMTADPFMPDHRHGPTVRPQVAPGTDGTYTITTIYFIMAGYWEVTLTLRTAAGETDSVMFPICIPG